MNSSTQKKILLVDDNAAMARTLKEILESKLAVSVKIADSGKQAIACMHSKDSPYNLVILELLVTDLNGIDVCTEMKRDSGLCRTPVFITSILPLESNEFQQSLKKYTIFNTVCGTLTKPFEPSVLAEKIEKLLTETNY